MKIAILEPLGINKNLLENKIRNTIGENPELVLFDKKTFSLISRNRDFDVVILSNMKFYKVIIEKYPKLKLMIVAFTGDNHTKPDCFKAILIKELYCSSYFNIAVADFIFGLVPSLSREIKTFDLAINDYKIKDNIVGFEFKGKKFGGLCFGRIELYVATIAKALGCCVFYYLRTKNNTDGFKYLNRKEPFKNCNIMSINIPNIASIRCMKGEKELKLLKKSTFLISSA